MLPSPVEYLDVINQLCTTQQGKTFKPKINSLEFFNEFGYYRDREMKFFENNLWKICVILIFLFLFILHC